MFGVFDRWYQRKFSDPNAMMLLMLIIVTAVILLIWGGILLPVIVSAIIAYLLDWPVTHLHKRGINRTLATSITLIIFILISILMLI
jgi:putative permease